MKHHLSPLTILAGAILFSTQSIADERIQVTASRISLPITASLNDVIIIDRDAIEASAATSLFEVLRGQAGLDLVRRGGLGQQFSLFVRGANSNQLLVLIDGVEVGSATLGSKALSDLSLSQVERIELIKGPRAALWGSKAMGGVLQIFTREIDDFQFAFGTGSNGYNSFDIGAGFQINRLEVQILADEYDLDGNDARFDQDPDLDGSTRDNLLIRAKWSPAEGHTFNYLNQTNEGLTEYDTSFGGDQLVFDNSLDILEYQGRFEGFNHALKLSRQRDDSTIQGEGATPFQFVTESDMIRYQLDYQVNTEWQLGASVEKLDEDVSESGSDYTVDKRTTNAAHLYSHYQSGAWLNEVALRYTDIDGLASNTSAHVGFGYRLAQTQLLSINFGEGFKAPTFNDLYFPFGGNPDLAYETSESVDVTYRQWFDDGQYSVSVYDNEVINLIQFVPDEDGFFSAVNVGKVNLTGVDVAVDWQAWDLAHQLSVSYVDAEDANTGQPLQLRASEQLSYLVNGQLAGNEDLSYQVQLIYTGERPDFDFQSFSAVDLDTNTEVHLSGSYRVSDSWTIQLRVDDVFNTQAINTSGYRPEGRTYNLFFKYGS